MVYTKFTPNTHSPQRRLQLEHAESGLAGPGVVASQDADLEERGHNPVVRLGLKTALLTNQVVQGRPCNDIKSNPCDPHTNMGQKKAQ